MLLYKCANPIRITTISTASGIFHLIHSAKNARIINGKVKVNRANLIIDYDVYAPLYRLVKDSYEWRYIVGEVNADGVYKYPLYNLDLTIDEYTLYPSFSINSLQRALGFHECIVLANVDLNVGIKDTILTNKYFSSAIQLLNSYARPNVIPFSVTQLNLFLLYYDACNDNKRILLKQHLLNLQ